MDMYTCNDAIVESCYVYQTGANGILFKTVGDGNIVRYNTIIGGSGQKGITLWEDQDNYEIYGNLLIGDFSSVAIDIGAYRGAANAKILNNTLVSFDHNGVFFGTYDYESPCSFSGNSMFKWNLLIGYDLINDGEFGAFVMFYNPFCCTACEGQMEINYNAYYSATDNFNGSCNASSNDNFTQWKSNCGEDANSSGDVALGFDMGDYSLPDTTSLTMDSTYGGRTWTVYGAVQDAAEAPGDSTVFQDIIIEGLIIN
jgi:hypothetical protein